MATDNDDDSGRRYGTPRGGAPIDHVKNLPSGSGRRRTPVRGVPPAPPIPDDAVPSLIDPETSGVIMLETDPMRRIERFLRHQATKPPPVSKGDFLKILITALVMMTATGLISLVGISLKFRDDLRARPTVGEVKELVADRPTKWELELRLDEVEDMVTELQRRLIAAERRP